MTKILILNGPNLNLLGKRDPDIYGHETLDDIKASCQTAAEKINATIDFRQSNHEGELVEWIQQAIDNIDALIINAAAYTHTSIAIHDALQMLSCPIIEVHLSNPQEREKFRHFSYITPLATEIISGKKGRGYTQAIENIKKYTKNLK